MEIRDGEALSGGRSGRPASPWLATPRRSANASDGAEAGLYRASDEHDACGVGFVADIKGRRSPSIVRDALTLLVNLEHRGASGSDPDTGDGAGILVQMPDRFLRGVAGLPLPPAGAYGAGLVFLPHEAEARALLRGMVERIAGEEGHPVLGWRPVPTNLAAIGRNAAAVAPVFEQVFVGRAAALDGPDAAARFERALYVIRKRVEQVVQDTRAGPRPPRLLRRQPVGPDAHLQGHAHGLAARGDVPRPGAPGLRVGAGPGAPALLDQHVPVVAAGPPLPLRRPQRRDQHPAGQRQLDAGARGAAPLERLRRRSGQGAAGHHARRQRHRVVRQRARVPGHGRTLAAARRADDDPRAVGRQSRRWIRRCAPSTSTTRR